MTDREVLLIAYGALSATSDGHKAIAKIEDHLFGDKPSEPIAFTGYNAPTESDGTYHSAVSVFTTEPEPTHKTRIGESLNIRMPSGDVLDEHRLARHAQGAPVQREPGTPGVDRPLKRSDVLK